MGGEQGVGLGVVGAQPNSGKSHSDWFLSVYTCACMHAAGVDACMDVLDCTALLGCTVLCCTVLRVCVND